MRMTATRRAIVAAALGGALMGAGLCEASAENMILNGHIIHTND